MQQKYSTFCSQQEQHHAADISHYIPSSLFEMSQRYQRRDLLPPPLSEDETSVVSAVFILWCFLSSFAKALEGCVQHLTRRTIRDQPGSHFQSACTAYPYLGEAEHAAAAGETPPNSDRCAHLPHTPFPGHTSRNCCDF